MMKLNIVTYNGEGSFKYDADLEIRVGVTDPGTRKVTK
jgi:hypothetical protein